MPHPVEEYSTGPFLNDFMIILRIDISNQSKEFENPNKAFWPVSNDGCQPKPIIILQ